MAGSSIAGRDAAPWVTDFLNAAYYRRAGRRERDVDDLRLAFASSRPTGTARRPAAGCASPTCAAFHRAFGARPLRHRALGARHARPRRSCCARRGARCSATGSRTPTPTTRAAAGASRSRRVEERAAYDPDGPARAGPARRADARERAAGRAGLAHLPAGRDAVGRGASSARSRGPRRGRTTRARSGASRRCAPGGLAGQTFEIEVAAGTDAGAPGLHARLRDDHRARHARTTPRALRA